MTKADNRIPIVAKAYAVVPSDDDTELDLYSDESTYAAKVVDLSRPSMRTVSPAFAHIPEAHGLTWDDDFFDDEEEGDIVAVFDLDYDLMEEFYRKIGIGALGVLLFIPQLLWIALLGLAPCYLNSNVRWCVRAQHVAITRDGIRFVRNKRKTCWGRPWSDAGKWSKTIPFDKITDCDVVEPAGNTCLVIPNTLHTVNIDTASNNKERHELSITGLKNPVAFKKLVWAMKRMYHPAVARLPSTMEMLGREEPTRTERKTHQSSDAEVARLLREIRDELRQNNEALRSMKQQPSDGSVEPTAPPEDL